jgi:hypothetical protein
MSPPSSRKLTITLKRPTPATVSSREAPTGAPCDSTTCPQPATGTEPTQMQESSAALREVRRAALIDIPLAHPVSRMLVQTPHPSNSFKSLSSLPGSITTSSTCQSRSARTVRRYFGPPDNVNHPSSHRSHCGDRRVPGVHAGQQVDYRRNRREGGFCVFSFQF